MSAVNTPQNRPGREDQLRPGSDLTLEPRAWPVCGQGAVRAGKAETLTRPRAEEPWRRCWVKASWAPRGGIWVDVGG